MEKMKLQSMTVYGERIPLIEDSISNIIEVHTQIHHLNTEIHIPKVEAVYGMDGGRFTFYATNSQTELIKKVIKLHYEVEIE